MGKYWIYHVSKFFSSIALPFFFGSVKVIGKKKIPKDAGIIFAPNHQGAFMDAVLVGTTAPMRVSFLTRSDVFNKYSRPILSGLSMIPIYRIRDGIQSLSQNEAIFQTCYDLLSRKEALLIFPEGNHSNEYFLRPLSKGTSRLALDARAQIDPATKVYIIPTGINYFSHKRPYAKIILNFGEPIALNEYMPLYHEHKQKAYNALKKDLSAAMKETLILPEQTEDYAARKKWIFQPKHENHTFESLRTMSLQPSVPTIKERGRSTFKQVLIHVLGVFNLVPLKFLTYALGKVKDPVFAVSIKYLAGGIAHALWWIVAFIIGASTIGPMAGFLFASVCILTSFGRQSLIRY